MSKKWEAAQGGVIAQQYIKGENEKNAKVSTTEVRKLLLSEINRKTQTIRRKEEAIRQLQSEIEVEQAGIEEARRLIKQMDLQTK